MLYSSTGDGAAAITCRHVWHRRWCGPSDSNPRSHRRQFRRFSFLVLRGGLMELLAACAMVSSLINWAANQQGGIDKEHQGAIGKEHPRQIGL